MALEDITKTITEEAQAEAKKIKSAGDKQVAEIVTEGKEKVKAEEVKINQRIEKEVQKVMERVKFQTNIAERNQLVAAKQKIVGEVFAKVLEQMSGLDENKYVEFVTGLVNGLPDVAEGEIVPVAGKEELTKRIIDGSQKSFAVSADSIPGVGGFIFRSENIEINNTFAALLDEKKGDWEIEVSKILFA
ncbi:hypothetical protein KJ903_02485 [Patescibacteria group bacterium]|nr:hypothetical protein [Patescibacteria group bacterium]